MCYNYTGSKFRLSMPYFSVGIIFSKHSIAHPLAGPRGFSRQSYCCTQHAHTYRIPMSGHCASTKSYMYLCDVMGH